jgi:hypothetical protein
MRMWVWMGEFRWLLVSAPGTPDVGINLKLAENPEQRNLVGKQGGGAPVFALATSDCRRDYERMKARDVALDGEPQTMPLAFESKCARRMDAHARSRSLGTLIRTRTAGAVAGPAGAAVATTDRGDAGFREWILRSIPFDCGPHQIRRRDAGPPVIPRRGRFFQDPLRRPFLDFGSNESTGLRDSAPSGGATPHCGPRRRRNPLDS